MQTGEKGGKKGGDDAKTTNTHPYINDDEPSVIGARQELRRGSGAPPAASVR